MQRVASRFRVGLLPCQLSAFLKDWAIDHLSDGRKGHPLHARHWFFSCERCSVEDASSRMFCPVGASPSFTYHKVVDLLFLKARPCASGGLRFRTGCSLSLVTLSFFPFFWSSYLTEHPAPLEHEPQHHYPALFFLEWILHLEIEC